MKARSPAATAPAGSTARKVADFQSAYLNEAAIEARGLAPLQPMFDRIAAAHDKAALTRLLGEGLRADVDPLNWGVYRSSSLLGLSVEHGNNGEKNYVAFLLQGAGHKREAEAPVPFDGPLDFVGRVLVEQFITFPRFVLSGLWLRNLTRG